MNEIFVSYAAEDKSRIQVLVDALEQRGWSIWWDRHIPVGTSYDQVIQDTLNRAACVIVVWTRHSVASRWVRSEAERAANQGKLVPILMDDVEIPLGFSLLQAANLVGWHGDPSHSGFLQLVEVLSSRLQAKGTVSPDGRVADGMRVSRKRSLIWLSAVLILLALTALAGLSLTRLHEVEIMLQVEATHIQFVSSVEQDLTGLLALSSLNAAGLQRIRVPRARSSAGRTLRSNEPHGTTIRLSAAGPASNAEPITLEPLTLAAQASVRLCSMPEQRRTSISIEGPSLDVRASLQGHVVVQLFKAASETLDFGSPKPLLLESGPSGIDLSLVISGLPAQVTPAPLTVSDLALYRIEERMADQGTKVQKIPTILGGKLSVACAIADHLMLTDGADIRFMAVQGTIDEIRFLQDRITLDFRGVARGMQRCRKDHCTTLMPTYLEWLISRIIPV